MRQSLAIAASLTSTALAQSASSLTFWLPGPANAPSYYSKHGLGTTTFPPVASIVTSNPATTVFALGCPTSTATPSSIFDGESYQTCDWATDEATYSIISKTKHVLHRSRDENAFSMWWTCDYDQVKTKMSCDLEIQGDVLDNTGGIIRDAVWPDERGNLMAWATAEIVTEGRFGELDCGIGDATSSARKCNSEGTGGKGTHIWSADTGVPTGLMTESASAPAVTGSSSGPARTGSGSGAAATASSTVSGSATTSTGAAAGFGVDALKLVGLVGGAALAAW